MRNERRFNDIGEEVDGPETHNIWVQEVLAFLCLRTVPRRQGAFTTVHDRPRLPLRRFPSGKHLGRALCNTSREGGLDARSGLAVRSAVVGL